jgi:putative tricarboxylic transport membrane protein
MIIRPDAEPEWPRFGKLVEILAAVAVMVAYAQFLPVAGFIIATAVASAYLAWRLGSGILAALIAGVLISVGIYVVFHLILGLSLARGPLGF